MSEQKIADITDVLQIIAEVIDDPPSTPAVAQLIAHKLQRGREKILRGGPASDLIVKDAGHFHTNVEVRALGERLFELGRRRGPGGGFSTLSEALAEIVRRNDGSPGKSVAVIEAAWTGIGGRNGDHGWRANQGSSTMT